METQTILYSVIITAYNYGRYLKRAIDSVLSQDFDRYEVILVDDGSEDDTEPLRRSMVTGSDTFTSNIPALLQRPKRASALPAEAMSFSSTRTTGSDRTR